MPLDPRDVIAENVPLTKASSDSTSLLDLHLEINDRLGGLPVDPSGYSPGELVVMGDDGLGAAPAADGVEPISCHGREFGHYKPNRIRVGGSGFSLNDDAHCGRLLVKSDGDAAIVSFDTSADPANGVSDNFTCGLWRQLAAGALEVRSTTFANDHPNGHRAVRAGGLATLIVDAETNVYRLIGETE
jgi:hypothetical protein